MPLEISPHANSNGAVRVDAPIEEATDALNILAPFAVNNLVMSKPCCTV